MLKWTLKLRIFLWLVLAGVVGWLLYMGIAPGGKISYVYDFTNRNYFIGKLTPKERVEPIRLENGAASQTIINEPVYFSLRTPRKFNKARVTFKYKNTSKPSIIEAGILVDKTIWRYNLRPIENKVIDQLSLVWDVAEENGVMLLQRNTATTSTPIKKHKTINNFLNNLPPVNEVALYNYNLKHNYVLEDYISLEEQKKIYTSRKNKKKIKDDASMDYALRGEWQFYTYIKNEDLDFKFTFSDLNKNRDSDYIDLLAFYNDQLIGSRHMDDNNGKEESNETQKRGELEFKIADLPEGVYKIELRGSDDVITEKIITSQQKLSFINKIWLAENTYLNRHLNTYLNTDSNELRAQTINPANLQTIKFNEEELEINETYKQFSMELNSGYTECRNRACPVPALEIEKGDIILAGDGMFSFSEDAFISPNFKKVDGKLDINEQGVNYVLAKYKQPDERDGWKIASAEFDLTKAYQEDGKYSFMISAPGLLAEDGVGGGIELGEIKVELEGRTLVEKIQEMP